MNLVEAWFGIIERQAIHRGTFGSVRELTTAIRQLPNHTAASRDRINSTQLICRA
jgi:hypothetical protein